MFCDTKRLLILLGTTRSFAYLKKIDIRNLTELNNTMHAAAAYVTELVGANKLPKTKKEPWWKRRLEGKL